MQAAATLVASKQALQLFTNTNLQLVSTQGAGETYGAQPKSKVDAILCLVNCCNEEMPL